MVDISRYFHGDSFESLKELAELLYRNYRVWEQDHFMPQDVSLLTYFNNVLIPIIFNLDVKVSLRNPTLLHYNHRHNKDNILENTGPDTSSRQLINGGLL